VNGAQLPIPVAVLIAILSHVLPWMLSATGSSVAVVVADGRCEIAVSLASTRRDYREAQAECRATGLPTVYFVSR